MTATARPQLLTEFIDQLERDGFTTSPTTANPTADPYVEIGLDQDLYAVADAADSDGLRLVLYRKGNDASLGAWFGVTVDTAMTILWGMKG